MNTLQPLVDPQSGLGCEASKLQAIGAALSQQILDGEDKGLGLFYNLSRLQRNIKAVQELFPEPFFLHTTALKANPLKSLLTFFRENGIGFEAASLGELTQALSVEKDGKWIVFDSPVKTVRELKTALRAGVYLNLDNFQELEKVNDILKEEHFEHVDIGIRVNPQLGAGKIKEMGTSSPTSKFGVPLGEKREELLAAYAKYPWLNCVHVHVGSQGCSLDMTVEGIKQVFEVALEVNKAREGQVKIIDIGGGHPVNFDSEEDHTETIPSLAEFSQVLRHNVPDLFSGKYKVITEFGRRYNAKAGFLLSRVEYTKVCGGRHIALTHAGADLFVRTVFMPNSWAIRISVVDSKGSLKKGNVVKQDIAGPCCHAGDIIAHERELPLLEPADWIIAHDTGAYYYSAFSYYNSRQAPPIWGFHEGKEITFNLLRKGHTVDETLAFFC